MNRQAFIALLWKEWREHQMRMVALCAVVAVWAVMQFPGGSGHYTRSVDSAFLVILMVAAVVMPIFVTMAIGSERASGSLDVLLHQPVPPELVLAVKTLIGAVTCLFPVLLIGLLGWLLIDPRQVPPDEVLDSTGFAAAGAVTAYLWMISLSARASNETVVGVTCVIVLVGSWLAIGLGSTMVEVYTGGRWDLERWVERNPWVAGPSLVALTCAIWWASACAFGAPPRRRSQAAAVDSTAPTWPVKVLPTTDHALRWKERLSNSGWSITALIVLGALSFLEWVQAYRYDLDDVLPYFLLAAVFLAVLLPVTSLGRDLRPGVFEMLQATPIDPRLWFQTKYRKGRWAVLWPCTIPLAIGGVLHFLTEVAIPAWAGGATTGQIVRWFLIEQLWHVTVALALAGSVVLLIYSASFLLGCALRQPVYAGMLATGFALMLMTVPETYDWERTVYRIFTGGDAVHGVPRSFTHSLWLVTSIAAFALSSLAKRAAWWVVRTSWPSERHRGVIS
jgi:ABC-type transport system involved in multi-copper enzyme maturation permease subunit